METICMLLFKNFTEVVQGKISSSGAILFSIAKQLLQFLVESIMRNNCTKLF